MEPAKHNTAPAQWRGAPQIQLTNQHEEGGCQQQRGEGEEQPGGVFGGGSKRKVKAPLY